MKRSFFVVLTTALAVMSLSMSAYAATPEFDNEDYSVIVNTRVAQSQEQFSQMLNTEQQSNETITPRTPASVGASGCIGSGCGVSYCLGSGCGASICIGSACVSSACAGSGCAISACLGSTCGVSGCIGSTCAYDCN